MRFASKKEQQEQLRLGREAVRALHAALGYLKLLSAGDDSEQGRRLGGAIDYTLHAVDKVALWGQITTQAETGGQ